MDENHKPPAPGRLRGHSNPLVLGELVISPATVEAWLFGRKLALTPREFDLLTHLAEHPGWVFSPEQLLHQVWGYGFVGDARVVSVHIGNLRRKLGETGSQPRLIHTVRGLGYKLMSAEALGATNATSVEDRDESAGERNPLIGRRAELILLAKALDAACQGRGSVALLVGEAGMGKTRLAQELDSVATLAGALVLWGRCHEAGALSPYWPWIQIAGELVAKLAEDQQRRDVLVPTRGLRDLLAEVTQSLPDPTSTDWAELADPRTTVLDALLHIHVSAAAERTLVLILDDLDQSDTASLLVLQVLASHLEKARILVVATMSTSLLHRGHPLRDTLAVLAKWGYQRIQLPGLTLPETAGLISLSTGKQPSQAVIDAVHRQSEGNPLFVSELAHLLAAEGRLDQEVLPPDQGMPLPAGVHDVIGRRLARVSPECQRLLELGSIVGRSFSLEVLHLASGLEFDRILELLTEALEAHLIQGEAERGHFRFTHSLVREVLVADLGDARRLGLYARLALALEQASDPEDVLEELAHYFCQAAPLGYGDKAIDYSRRAGARAMERFAYEDAAQHFHTALTLMPASKAKVEERRQAAVSLQESHCQALALCSRPDEAVAAYHRGLSLVSPADWLGRARLHRMGALAWHRPKMPMRLFGALMPPTRLLEQLAIERTTNTGGNGSI